MNQDIGFKLAVRALSVFSIYNLVATMPFYEILFSTKGIVPDYSVSHYCCLLPSFLGFANSWSFFLGICILFLAAQIALLVNPLFTWSYFFSWYFMASLLAYNPFTDSPEYTLISWLYLWIGFFIIFTKKWSWGSHFFKMGIWLFISSAYIYSFILKAKNPLWLRGEALEQVLNIHIVLRSFIIESGIVWSDYAPVLKLATWLVLCIHGFFWLGAINSKVKQFFWTASFSIHVITFIVFQLTPVSLGMIVIHLFIWPYSKGLPTKIPAAIGIRKTAMRL